MTHGRSRTRRLAARAVALGAVALAGLTACSPLTPGDIPLEPSAPWACDGVARDSIDKIIGEGYTIVQLGEWTDLEEDPFTCEVNGIHGHVIVDVTERSDDGASEAGAEQLSEWYDAGGEQISNPQGVPGEGYRTGTPGETITAGWVCGVRTAQVTLESVWLDGTRNQLADAANLLQQVLPYACGNEMVPGVDYSPSED